MEFFQSKNFENNKKEIDQENRKGIELILLFDAIILLINLLGNFGHIIDIQHMQSFIALIIYVIVALILYFLFLRNKAANCTLWIYLIETPLLLITLLSGTINKPHDLTFTFLIYLLLFPLLILDKPWRISLFVLTISAIYAVIDYIVKDPEIFNRDIMHLCNVCLMTIAASFFFLSVRIKNIEYAHSLSEKAYRDSLTGLYNRSGGSEHFNPNKAGLLIFLDLDQFKQINDKFGHAEGDKVLIETADVLRSCFRVKDIIVREGGDEFTVYAAGAWSMKNIEKKLSQLLESIRTIKSSSNGLTISMTASIGCVYAPNGCESLDLMTRTADHEMYHVKENGKNNYAISVI